MPEPIEAISFIRLPGIRHGFFTRLGGVSERLYATLNCGPGSQDAPSRIAENRARVAERLGVQHLDVVTLYQVHSATALCVSAPLVPGVARPKADAVVTRTPGLAIGVLTADCAPVLFADPDAGVVAAAHAGWRGALAGVLEATIAEMERQGARRNCIYAAIGPAINQDSYEVGPEFEAELTKSCADNARYFVRNNPHARAHFDLPAYVEDRLAAAQISEIERRSLCTYENESLFYSFRRSQHRAEGDYGRQISAIVVT
jgi:purine-nucleoside/S-methyl-5'-thioadenosine phosphorylase / adenosine deaminase